MSAAAAINLAALAGFIIGTANGVFNMRRPTFPWRGIVAVSVANGAAAWAISWLAGVA